MHVLSNLLIQGLRTRMSSPGQRPPARRKPEKDDLPVRKIATFRGCLR
jgi:hypothetical protein